jgi:hypothetical protein
MQRALDENYSHLAIAGAPVEMSMDVSPTPVDKQGIIEFPVFLAPSFEYQKKENGHDFFDVPVDREIRCAGSEFFHGVSGGAVWRLVNLFEQDPPMHQLQSTDYVLAGIAFWQYPENPRTKIHSRARAPIALRKVFARVTRLVKWAKRTPPMKPKPTPGTNQQGTVFDADLPRVILYHRSDPNYVRHLRPIRSHRHRDA